MSKHGIKNLDRRKKSKVRTPIALDKLFRKLTQRKIITTFVGRIIRSNKEPLKNGSGQRFLYAKYGQDWEIELRLLTDNYFDALRRLGYRISFDEAKDHLVWGIDAYLLRVLKGQGTDVRLKEIERCYKGIIGSQIYS